MLLLPIRMNHSLLGLVTIASVLLAGCKDDKADKVAGKTEPTTLPAAKAEPAGFPLRPGETYAGGKQLETNLVSWKVEDGSIVQLGIVTTSKTADGREHGVLRAFHAGSDTHDVGPTYSLDPTIEHWSELKLLANNRVMFRYGEAGQGPRARNAVLLRWDAEARRVRIAKRWTGASGEPEPAWLLSGEYKVAPESEGLCLAVIARIVTCEGDAKFREAMFRRDDVADKAAMQQHFDTHVAQWKKPGEAKAQCQKWAGAGYADTHFSEPAKLKRLAAETKHDCAFFASEIVDEGGLPTALTES
jgi:hypothetical protein